MNESMLEKYARLSLEVGVGLQPGQRLLIAGQVDAAPFVRCATEIAYKMGARYVSVYWEDDSVRLSRFKHAPKNSFAELHQWHADAVNEPSEAGDALLAIFSSDPGLLEGFDPGLIATESGALNSARGPFWHRLGSNIFNWTVVPVATQSWANRIFPNDPNALEKLERAIHHSVYLDTPDPIAAWAKNREALRTRREFLNAKRYHSLRYTAPGTKLEIGLADGHVWVGGETIAPNGKPYVSDLPTFEVFTAPHRARVNGFVRGTKPINSDAGLIEGWNLEFKDGCIIKASAEKGQAALESFLEMTDGVRFLGEVALVAAGSPVEETGVVFRRALMDENAASHIAVGSAYRGTIAGGETMSDEEFAAKGGNISDEHRDIMSGSSAMDVDGVFADGSSEALMRAGQFVFEARV